MVIGAKNFVLFFQDLIEMVVQLQDVAEKQAKKQSDLESYIDSLLTKVIANAPELLQKNAQMEARFGITSSSGQGGINKQ